MELTAIPFSIQVMVGTGMPVAVQRRVTKEPKVTLWDSGARRILAKTVRKREVVSDSPTGNGQAGVVLKKCKWDHGLLWRILHVPSFLRIIPNAVPWLLSHLCCDPMLHTTPGYTKLAPNLDDAHAIPHSRALTHPVYLVAVFLYHLSLHLSDTFRERPSLTAHCKV